MRVCRHVLRLVTKDTMLGDAEDGGLEKMRDRVLMNRVLVSLSVIEVARSQFLLSFFEDINNALENLNGSAMTQEDKHALILYDIKNTAKITEKVHDLVPDSTYINIIGQLNEKIIKLVQSSDLISNTHDLETEWISLRVRWGKMFRGIDIGPSIRTMEFEKTVAGTASMKIELPSYFAMFNQTIQKSDAVTLYDLYSNVISAFFC
jgi:hypothetical protein